MNPLKPTLSSEPLTNRPPDPSGALTPIVERTTAALYWRVPNRVLHLTLSGQVTGDDLRQITLELVKTLATLRQTTYLIVDVRDLTANLATWDAIRSTPIILTSDVSLELTLAFGQKQNKLIRLMLINLLHFSRRGMSHYDTLEEALAATR